MQNQSLWEAISIRNPDYPTLTNDLEVDVAIIGGGITGITAASELVKSGKKVAILEAHQIGSGTTGFSTGNLYIAVQPLYQNIADKFDLEAAKTVAYSRQLAIDYIEKNVMEKNINCHFSRRPWYAYSEENEDIIVKEAELFKRMEIGINQVKDLPFSFKFKSAIEMPRQARFNPLQYVISMAADLKNKGCLIFENTRIIDLKEEDICTLKTIDATIHARKVLLATHTPIGINALQLFTAPYRSYVVAVKTEQEHYPEGHLWNLDKPHFTLCTHPASTENPELIMIAGSHHKTGQSPFPSSHYKELEKLLSPLFQIKEIVYHWSAQHYQSADYVPYIGLANNSAKHTYLATGYWADGLIYGTLAGILFGDIILKNEYSFKQIYQSTRSKLKNSSSFFFKENSNVLLQYLKDYPLISANMDDIKIGEGRVIEVNREKYAVARDSTNQLHVVSAVCPHMKCIVNWNDSEKTWDCPCHGSRFTCEGKVIEGPALTGLEKKIIDSSKDK